MGGQESSQKGNSSSSSSGERNGPLAHFISAVSQDGSDHVSKDKFISYFPSAGQTLAEKLFSHMSPSGSELRKRDCSVSLSKILTLTSTSVQSRTYIEVFCGRASLNHQDVTCLLQSSLRLFLVSSGTSFSQHSVDDDRVINTLATLLTSKGQGSSAADWIDGNCPELFTGMHKCLVGWLRGEEKCLSLVDTADIIGGRLICKSWWWILQSSLSSVFLRTLRNQTKQNSNGATEDLDNGFWTLLYSSQDHGLSTNRLQHHVFGYRGPTLMLLSCDEGYTYAVALDTEWREGTQPWGGSSCCVMRLSPDVKKLEEGDSMILFNERSRNIPRGISIGRNSKHRVLKLKEGLDVVEHNYTSGSVHTLEVWGCGDSGTRVAQAKQKKMETKDAERAAKVKLPGQWDDSPDKMLLEWGGVKVNHAEQFARD
ncbi:uncharacterized protein [Asterias amurensis]|uniref:uncharacterized protein n=1 Tax=Asterias amurensis TaxID=7602 RepID=UPI003AB2B756